MFTDRKYSTTGKKGGGAGVRDAANYLFDEMAEYLENGKEYDIEGLGLSRYHGRLFDALGVPAHDAYGKALAVDKEAFVQIMLGNHPETGQRLKQWKKEHHPGSEIILAPDGDVSIFYSRASLDEKKMLREMIQRATARTMQVLEDEVCKIRITERNADGRKVTHDVIPNGGIGIMEFNHFEARMVDQLAKAGIQTRPDCSLHSHLSLPNLAVHNGEIYSLENSYVKNAQTKCDMVFKNELYNEMSAVFGLKFTRELVETEKYQSRSKESFRFKIEGITDEMRGVHGTRSKELKKAVELYLANKIQEKAAEYIAQGKLVPASVYNLNISPEEEKQISEKMRAAKGGFTQQQMVEAWDREWDEKGYSHDRLAKIMEHGRALDPADRFEKAPVPEQLMDLLTAKKQNFTQKDFRDLFLQHHAGTGKSYEKLKEEIKIALDQHGVELKADQLQVSNRERRLQGEDFNRVFTSKKLHEAEKNALGWVVEHKDRKSRVSISEAEAIKGIHEWEKLKSLVLKTQIRLNAEQRQAAIAMCAGRGVVTAIAGHAGTGKTFSIQAATHCLNKKNFRQAGAAVSGRAAENLSVEGLGGAEATSVAAFLKRYETETGAGRKVAIPQILWLDEAATTNSDQLSRILKIGANTNEDFRVICSYDFNQTQAIGPTGLLKDIVNEVGQQELKEVKRQKTPEALKVATLARDGDLSDLKQHMKDQTRFDGAHGWYSVKEDRSAQIDELAQVYMTNALPIREKLVVGLLRRDIEDLNAKIREARIENGEIEAGKPVLCSYKDEESALAIGHATRQEKLRNFAVGDRIIIKEGFKIAVGSEKSGKPIREQLLTGYAGEIIEQNAHDAFMKVRLDTGKIVSWDFAKEGQNTVDHFYAGTVNSIQGASVKWCAGMDAGFQDKAFAEAAAVNQLSREPVPVSREVAELGQNRNLLYTMLSRHGYEANFITTTALDQTFEQRYATFGLEESTIKKVLEPQSVASPAAVEKSIEPVIVNNKGWARLDLEEHQAKQIAAEASTAVNLNRLKEKQHGEQISATNASGWISNADSRGPRGAERMAGSEQRHRGQRVAQGTPPVPVLLERRRIEMSRVSTRELERSGRRDGMLLHETLPKHVREPQGSSRQIVPGLGETVRRIKPTESVPQPQPERQRHRGFER